MVQQRHLGVLDVLRRQLTAAVPVSKNRGRNPGTWVVSDALLLLLLLLLLLDPCRNRIETVRFVHTGIHAGI
jgi:hypothetical protein